MQPAIDLCAGFRRDDYMQNRKCARGTSVKDDIVGDWWSSDCYGSIETRVRVLVRKAASERAYVSEGGTGKRVDVMRTG